MLTTKRTYTLADLMELPEDSDLYEILGGKLVVWNAPNINHATIVTELFALLVKAKEAGFGYVLAATTAVAFDYPSRGLTAEDVTHPDLLFIRAEREHILADRAVGGVPDLVIEVLSPSDHKRDLVEKLDVHQRHGLPHYWIADAEARAIRQYVLEGEPYVAGRYGAPTLLRAGDTLGSPLFPNIMMPVAQVFQHVRRRRNA